MSWLATSDSIRNSIKVIAAALAGAAIGLVATAVALGSLPFAFFGAVGAGVVSAIAAQSRYEVAEA